MIQPAQKDMTVWQFALAHIRLTASSWLVAQRGRAGDMSDANAGSAARTSVLQASDLQECHRDKPTNLQELKTRPVHNNYIRRK